MPAHALWDAELAGLDRIARAEYSGHDVKVCAVPGIAPCLASWREMEPSVVPSLTMISCGPALGPGPPEEIDDQKRRGDDRRRGTQERLTRPS